MAQTTDAISFANVQLEISDDDFSSNIWDASGFIAAVTISAGGRQIGEEYTADGDVAILTAGKREPLDVTARIVYTEGATDPVERLRAAFEAGSAFYFRWSPKGGGTGDFEYTCQGILSTPVYPQGEVGPGDPVVVESTLRTPKVTKAVHT